MGGSTQGGDGKELGRFMELGSSCVCVWRVVNVGRVGPPVCQLHVLEATGLSTLFMKQRAYKTWNESMKKPCT